MIYKSMPLRKRGFKKYKKRFVGKARGRSMNWKSLVATNSKTVIHTFRETFIDTDITSSNAIARSGAYAINVAQFANFAAWTQLYDQYRIIKVIVRFMPSAVMADNPYPDIYALPQLYTVIDYDDSSAPASLTEMLQYNTLKIAPVTKTHIRSFVPAIAASVYQGVASTGYAVKKYQWLNVANSTIPHYALKYYMPPHSGPATSVVRLQVFITAVVQCRATR